MDWADGLLPTSGLPTALRNRREDIRDVTEKSGVGVLDARLALCFADSRNKGSGPAIGLRRRPRCSSGTRERKILRTSDACNFSAPPRGLLRTLPALTMSRRTSRLYLLPYSYYVASINIISLSLF